MPPRRQGCRRGLALALVLSPTAWGGFSSVVHSVTRIAPSVERLHRSRSAAIAMAEAPELGTVMVQQGVAASAPRLASTGAAAASDPQEGGDAHAAAAACEAPEGSGGIFCTRSLNLANVKCVGYDMDYTLIDYKFEVWEARAYHYCKEHLRSKGFPVSGLRLNPDLVTRGIIIDKELGNLVKADRFGYVRRAMHGTRRLSESEVHEAYSRITIDLRDSRFHFLNTLFSISEGAPLSAAPTSLSAALTLALTRSSPSPISNLHFQSPSPISISNLHFQSPSPISISNLHLQPPCPISISNLNLHLQPPSPSPSPSPTCISNLHLQWRQRLRLSLSLRCPF